MRTSSGTLLGPVSPSPGELASLDLVPGAIYRATRSLFCAHTPEQATAILAAAVQELGGKVVPHRTDDADIIPIDISLGQAEPLFPAAPTGSPQHRLLAGFMPQLAQDARTALDSSQRAQRLAQEAGVDILTGLPNRRTMSRLLGRLKDSDILVAIDLDNFRQVNETHGYNAGDDILRRFARAMQHAVRASDHLGRMGAEEFLLVLQNANVTAAFNLLARLREHWTSVRPLPITFSAGIAPVPAGDWRRAMQAAGRALFRAKGSGCDRWEAAQDSDYA